MHGEEAVGEDVVGGFVHSPAAVDDSFQKIPAGPVEAVFALLKILRAFSGDDFIDDPGELPRDARHDARFFAEIKDTEFAGKELIAALFQGDGNIAVAGGREAA